MTGLRVLDAKAMKVPEGLDAAAEVIERYGSPWQTAMYSPKPGDVCVEIGSFCGLHSIRLADLVGPTGVVVAVEMVDAWAAMGVLNCKAAGVPWVDCLLAAVGCPSEEEGWASVMHIDRWQRNSLAGGIVDRDGTTQETRSVRLASLAMIVETIGRPVDLLAVSVNGTELALFEKLPKRAWDLLKNVTIDARYYAGEPWNPKFEHWQAPPLRALFEAHGFEVTTFHGWFYARRR